MFKNKFKQKITTKETKKPINTVYKKDGGPSVVLFGPTDEKFFGYEENINITARTCPHPCEWLTKDWMKKCLRTNYQQPCMQDIKPKDVLSQIKRVINNE